MKILMLGAALLLPLSAHAQNTARQRARPPALAAQSSSLSQHLEAALAIDASMRALEAQRMAAGARGITARSAIAGPPSISGSFRSDTRGPREQREMEMDFAAPLWLPGQRSALRGTVEHAVTEYDQRILLRRLEVAGLLREAWWDAAEARRAVQLARDRLGTAREIARDVTRRAELGDIPPTEALLARNETLGAELSLAQAESTAALAVAAYRVMTGGMEPNLPVEAIRARGSHPALRAAEAAVAHAESRQRLVAATPRDNPELGTFLRQENGRGTNDSTSIGLRFRLPLATEARNAPRRAAAQSEVTQAVALLAQARRLVEAEVGRARAQLAASEQALRLARQRLAVANEQEGIAVRAFRSGETGTFDLYRVRQLRLEAANDEGRASVDASRARSRVNQAMGVVP
ncbi:TolC family protein [Roseococcus sp. SYP-B2431]|uniref:TolC family protein n=1 Tax=Roseococcus sp. SYP-B2431 TaxID=2496640 RepID=UPI00103B5AF9|nr:TolC family protein [Roseococcus sp. SYP-B2431]TCH96829.1 TolC family protein [Roseococcus sp. SYP-B2431]